MRRILISNLTAWNVAPDQGILIAGLPGHPVEDLTLTNILIGFAGGGTREQGAREMPELEKDYPEPMRFGTLTAWAVWARHVKNLALAHVEFRFAKDDLRPAVILDDVAGADLDHAKLPHTAGTASLGLKNVTGLAIHNSPGLPETNQMEKIANEKL